jgi:acyl carrier protein
MPRGQKMSTFDEVKAVISQKLDNVEITPDMVLKDHLDSLDMFDVMFEAEDKYGVKIPTDQIANLKTVQDVVDLIEGLK